MFNQSSGRGVLVWSEVRVHVARHSWVPAADVYRIASGWIVKVELAAVRPEDVTVAIDGNSLRIYGVRHDLLVESGIGRRCESLEIPYGRFERRFELSGSLDRYHVATEFRDGMLLVKIVAEESR